MDDLTARLAKATIATAPIAPPKTLPGLSQEYESLLELIELPSTHAAAFARLKATPPRGVLIYGPPGVGKTHLVQHIAKATGASLTTIEGPSILSGYLGESESNLRDKFSEAEALSQAGPSILFIDEIDALAPSRATSSSRHHESRIVAQLLTLMDGVRSTRRTVVIGATNRPNAIDSALRRPGRLDREIFVDAPDEHARHEILASYLARFPAHTVDIPAIARATNGYVGADLAALYRHAAEHAVVRARAPHLTTDDVVLAMRAVAPSLTRALAVPVAQTAWTDIGGLARVKRALVQAVQWPLEHARTMARLGVRAPRGVLLHGPPGCSKTTLVRAIATQTHASFFSLSGAAVYSPFVGDAERVLRDVFRKAREAAPTVVFLDEVEALVGKRGGVGGGVQERVLTTLLNEMDGVEDARGVLVVGATNRVDMIDSALLRPGRFDRIVYVAPPGVGEREEILHIKLRGVPVAEDVDLGWIAENTEGFSGADIANLAREAALLALRSDIESRSITMTHFKKTLEAIRPSLDRELMEYYERMQQEYS